MPTSSADPISDVMGLVSYWEPKSVLDIGCGFGKYGVLLREYLDVDWGRLARKSWKTRIDAVEIFPAYISQLHSFVYDEMIIGDVRNLKLKKYDVILMADVIEHMSKKEGVSCVKKLIKLCKHLLITTPNGFRKQKTSHGNKYEKHLSGWALEDFMPFKPRAKLFKGSNMLLVRIDA